MLSKAVKEGVNSGEGTVLAVIRMAAVVRRTGENSPARHTRRLHGTSIVPEHGRTHAD
jgi:hypothetical protein